jgi:hypothetical protein
MARTRACILTPIAGEIRLDSPYDEALIAALHRDVPRDERRWDGAYWYITRAYEATAIALAQGFPVAQWVEGRRVTDLHTGRTWEQLGLF